jgi:hypothetical protein
MREVVMLTRVTIAVVGTLTMLLLAPLEAKASVQGIGQSAHKGQHLTHHQFRPRHHHSHLSPSYGYYNVPPYISDYDMTYSTPETAAVAPTPPTVGCQHSEQTVKVPSENGGVREVTILRC